MKKIINFYNDFFRIEKDKKIREKVMLVRVIITVAIIITCLMATSITAYAYFSYNITASSSIKAANFKTDISVKVDGTSEELTLENAPNSRFIALNANTKYHITINVSEQCSANTGFVKITAKNSDEAYYTYQFSNEAPKTLEFYITPSAETELTFVDCWGTSVYYSDYQNGIVNPFYITPNSEIQNIVINVNSISSQSVDDETNNDIAQPSTEDNISQVTSKESNTNAVVSSKPSKTEEKVNSKENITSEEKTGSNEQPQSSSNFDSTPIENSENEAVLNDETNN